MGSRACAGQLAEEVSGDRKYRDLDDQKNRRSLIRRCGRLELAQARLLPTEKSIAMEGKAVQFGHAQDSVGWDLHDRCAGAEHLLAFAEVRPDRQPADVPSVIDANPQLTLEPAGDLQSVDDRAASRCDTKNSGTGDDGDAMVLQFRQDTATNDFMRLEQLDSAIDSPGERERNADQGEHQARRGGAGRDSGDRVCAPASVLRNGDRGGHQIQIQQTS